MGQRIPSFARAGLQNWTHSGLGNTVVVCKKNTFFLNKFIYFSINKLNMCGMPWSLTQQLDSSPKAAYYSFNKVFADLPNDNHNLTTTVLFAISMTFY